MYSALIVALTAINLQPYLSILLFKSIGDNTVDIGNVAAIMCQRYSILRH